MAEPIEMPFGIWIWVDTRNHILDGSPDPHANGQLLGERTCPSYFRTVCSSHLSCGTVNFDSREYSISMQSIKLMV